VPIILFCIGRGVYRQNSRVKTTWKFFGRLLLDLPPGERLIAAQFFPHPYAQESCFTRHFNLPCRLCP
jgi:hypothetical protein